MFRQSFSLHMMFQSLQSLAYLAFICAIDMFTQSLFSHAKVSTFDNDST